MAPDVELHRAVDWRGREIGGLLRRLIHREWPCIDQWGVLKPDGLEGFYKPPPPPPPSVTALPVAPETPGGLEKVFPVYPHPPGPASRPTVQRTIHALPPPAAGPAANC